MPRPTLESAGRATPRHVLPAGLLQGDPQGQRRPGEGGKPHRRETLMDFPPEMQRVAARQRSPMGERMAPSAQAPAALQRALTPVSAARAAVPEFPAKKPADVLSRLGITAAGLFANRHQRRPVWLTATGQPWERVHAGSGGWFGPAHRKGHRDPGGDPRRHPGPCNRSRLRMTGGG